MTSTRAVLAACFAMFLPAVSAAQETPLLPTGALSRVRFDLPPDSQQTHQVPAPADDMKGRACPGCPKRSLAWPFVHVLWLNIMYNGINHASGHETADISPKTWWANMQAGFEWDNNPWLVNQIGHPWQGSNYFTAARANGLGFWESSAMAAFGSGTWEYYFENNRASLNDIINTTLGGIAIGEALHRFAWMIRDPHNEKRRSKEWAALAVDPLGGLQRLISGDANRIADKPPGMIPSSFRYYIASGVMWQGASAHQAEDTALPFFDVALRYGDTRSGRSTVPYESFDAAFSFGGGGNVTQSGIRGRLFGQRAKAFQFGIFQTFDFIMNHAYDYGGQGAEVEMGLSRALSDRTTLWMTGTMGVSLLGAVNTLLPPPSDDIDLPRGGGSDGSRQYDYGPGFRWGGIIQFLRGSSPVVTVSYQGYHVAVVDGQRSNHVLQRLYADGRLPLGHSLALGAAGEFFFRKAYFYGMGNRTDESPQFRVYGMWSR